MLMDELKLTGISIKMQVKLVKIIGLDLSPRG